MGKPSDEGATAPAAAAPAAPAAPAEPVAPESDCPESVGSLDGETMTEVDSSDDEDVDMDDDGDEMDNVGKPTDVPQGPDPFAMVEIEDDDCPGETVVVSNPDGSSIVYEVDPKRDSQIEEYRLPALATKIAEHPPPLPDSSAGTFLLGSYKKNGLVVHNLIYPALL